MLHSCSSDVLPPPPPELAVCVASLPVPLAEPSLLPNSFCPGPCSSDRVHPAISGVAIMKLVHGLWLPHQEPCNIWRVQILPGAIGPDQTRKSSPLDVFEAVIELVCVGRSSSLVGPPSVPPGLLRSSDTIVVKSEIRIGVGVIRPFGLLAAARGARPPGSCCLLGFASSGHCLL